MKFKLQAWTKSTIRQIGTNIGTYHRFDHQYVMQRFHPVFCFMSKGRGTVLHREELRCEWNKDSHAYYDRVKIWLGIFLQSNWRESKIISNYNFYYQKEWKQMKLCRLHLLAHRIKLVFFQLFFVIFPIKCYLF